MDDVDIIQTEGYLRTGKHKIEVVRVARSSESICAGDELLALAACRREQVQGLNGPYLVSFSVQSGRF